MPNFFGWLFGVALGVLMVVTGLIAAIALGAGVAVPAAFAFLVAAVTAVVNTITPTGALILAAVLTVAFFLWAYALATVSVAPSLPFVTLPLAAQVPTPGGAPVQIANVPGELFARGMLAGLAAAINAGIIGALPVPGIATVVAIWAFLLISIAAFPPIAHNLVYQGFLGWAAWLFPLSYLATAVGLLLFIVNAPVVLFTLGFAAFRIDWTTGVIETAGGLSGVTGFSGGFSLGNFNFVVAQPVTASLGMQGGFRAPSISSHETGHTLNTAAFGGVVLWINAVDENVPPIRRLNLAYGELGAESHRMAMPGPPPAEFFVDIWG